MTAEKKLEAINNALEAGRTVYICNYNSAIKVTPKTAQRWAASGRPLFKISGDSLYIGAGKRYNCINWAELRVA